MFFICGVQWPSIIARKQWEKKAEQSRGDQTWDNADDMRLFLRFHEVWPLQQDILLFNHVAGARLRTQVQLLSGSGRGPC